MTRRLKTTKAGVVATAAAVAALAMTGCDEPRITYPDALRAPTAIVAVDGPICLPQISGDAATLDVGPLPACGDSDGADRGFGLAVNQRSGTLSVLALGQEEPLVVNLDSRRPGLTGIDVGPRPVDLAVTGEGTAAVVANEGDATLTGVDLWSMRPLEERLELAGTPRALAAMAGVGDDDETAVVAVTRVPNQLWVAPGLSCERPGDDVDRRDYLPEATCQWGDGDEAVVDLDGRPTDLAVDEGTGQAWVSYRDRAYISQIAVTEAGLGDDGACLADEATAPCEMARIVWGDDENESDDGANEVAIDPLGLFVYALDRTNSEVFVIDRRRGELIDAAQAAEPPIVPFQESAAVPVSSGSLAMSADVEREILDAESRHVQYRIGALLASHSGQLYSLGVADIECIYEGDEPLGEAEFVFDAAARQASDEMACLEAMPAFPLGGNPDEDDDETLESLRYVEGDGARLGISPIFGLRDASVNDGQVRGRAQCEQPDELLDAMREVAEESTVLGCGSPLMAQPVAPDVDDDRQTYADAQRLALATNAEAWFDADGEPLIVRSVDDRRLLNEEWTITYQGRLPTPGNEALGLVDREDDSRFRSGGPDLCAAGAEVGDRLSILSEPTGDGACEVYQGSAAQRTYEIVDVGPFGVELAVIDGEETVDELPSRDCFDRGLRYAIRPQQAWTVIGSSSGMASPWEADGDSCVLRDGADTGRLDGRVATGDIYRGPYFQFRMRPGTVDPVQGQSFTMRVDRDFARVSERFYPDGALIMPRQVAFLPDVGAGRLVSVVDSGGHFIYLRNLASGDESFIR